SGDCTRRFARRLGGTLLMGQGPHGEIMSRGKGAGMNSGSLLTWTQPRFVAHIAATFLTVVLFAHHASARASGLVAPWPADAQAPLPGAWKAQYHPDIAAHTRFSLVEKAGVTLLQANANQSYGTLVHAFAQPQVLSTMGWAWQVLEHPAQAKLQTKAGDDAGAKVCAFVQIDESRLSLGTRLALGAARTLSGEPLPAATLCYVWGSPGEPVGMVFNNPYTDRVKNMVLRDSSPGGGMVTESRDLQADARLAFGKELPDGPVRFTGIALGTDADNTKSKATALFGSIVAK
ncbi:MAG TPA: DUF3047 domain-containing protein, partial [Limnobacter sp.]|nr:DUF3047 domain-containing protein [Limnobacter sp.]